MDITSKLVGVLFSASMLASCATTAQNSYAPTNANSRYDQMVKWDQEAVAHGAANPIILKYDAQMANLQPGSPEYERLSRLKLAADRQQYQRLWDEGRVGTAPSTPIPIGGTLAPGNMPQPRSSGPDLGAIGWTQQGGLHVCPDGVGMVGTGPSGEPLCD